MKPLQGDKRQEQKLRGIADDTAPCPPLAGVCCGEQGVKEAGEKNLVLHDNI